MKTGLAAVRARHEHEWRQKQLLLLQERLGKGERIRLEQKWAKALLLRGSFLWEKVQVEPKFKSLGLGVYEVWAEAVK